ncbi:MAG: FHA domain-containing protein [Gallionellaceae bacterium]|nr:FHA domain-containing protein [Gallionellaceae bacterium]
MPKLVVSIGERILGEFPVTKERTTIGRKPSNDIQIDNLTVSSEHAVIIKGGDLYVIEDLGSANGTLVHNQAVTKQLLDDNDLITAGECQISFIEGDVHVGDVSSPVTKALPVDSKKSAEISQPAKDVNQEAATASQIKIIKCPHCSYKRQPGDAQFPKDQCPSCGVIYTAPIPPIMTAESTSGDRLEVYSHRIMIKRKMGIKVLLQSLKGDLLEGIKGDKEIPLRSIAAIQFKAASTLLSGYIQFTLIEDSASKGGFKVAGLDENTVEFVKREEPEFRKIKDFLDAKIGEISGVSSATSKTRQ